MEKAVGEHSELLELVKESSGSSMPKIDFEVVIRHASGPETSIYRSNLLEAIDQPRLKASLGHWCQQKCHLILNIEVDCISVMQIHGLARMLDAKIVLMPGDEIASHGSLDLNVDWRGTSWTTPIAVRYRLKIRAD